MTEQNDKTSSIETSTRTHPRRVQPRKAVLGASALGILLVGLAGGVAWSAARGHDATFDAAITPTPIAQLTDASSVGIDGQVAEIFGNKFVVTDGTARALVETGRAGEGGTLVTAGETVTVQGRFDDGFLHASAIRHADQRVDELDPPPPHERGRGPEHGPRHGPDHGPRHDDPIEAN